MTRLIGQFYMSSVMRSGDLIQSRNLERTLRIVIDPEIGIG